MRTIKEILDQGKKIRTIIRNRFLDRRIDGDGDSFYEYGNKTQKYLNTLSDKDLMDLQVFLEALKDIDLGGYRENSQQRVIYRMVESEINNRSCAKQH